MNKVIKYFCIFYFVIIALFSCKKETSHFNTEKEKKIITCNVVFVEGNAFVLNQQVNQWEQIVAGDTLKESDTLKTESKSNVEIQFNDGSIVRIKENSELKISKLYSEKDINNTKLFLNSGTLLAKPERQTEGSIFEVETKSITAGVRGTEFIVIAENNISKVAVKTGKVIIKKKLTVESLDKIKEIDFELAKKIDDAIVSEVELSQNEKVVVSDEDVENFNKKIEKRISDIAKELEVSKNEKDDFEIIINKVERETINEISLDSKKILQKDNVLDKEKKELNFKDFESIGKVKIEDVMETTTTTIKLQQQDEKVKTENKKEEKGIEKKELVTVIDKINNLGISFSEKNTGITTDGKFIYIASDVNKSLFAINPAGKLLWKFSNTKLKKIESFIVPYKNYVIFSSYDSIFVLKVSSGEIYQSLDITNGTSFWASPIQVNNGIIIPTSRYTYRFDGNNISQITEIEETKGQIYLTSNKNSLYIVDSLYQNIKEFNLNTNKIVWTSDNLLSSSYISPVIVNKYLLIADNEGNVYRFNISSKSQSYDLVKIGVGVTSNILVLEGNLYFIASNGFLYTVNLNTFSSFDKIAKVDNSPNSDKYLKKRLISEESVIYFASDRGNIFKYDPKTNEASFIENEVNKEKYPLIGTPVVINNEIFVIDTNSNIYKCYKAIR